eukprot:CAMPEP_0170515808 /NCGR_PEP_ID=MMETSP0209-20121228/2210_1 /TAXON_ID=665100 ORGANISM="Litonotus pictus, Strain P1" /NCGR_SAMPLE_ID=MMETSP0209 /ASSEMBLY_ACC=CAM_ASM_000301 /LENGTH=43 /DNA_ID= /DNA_START= /DNA_END= /DNA_ORIENTATION=
MGITVYIVDILGEDMVEDIRDFGQDMDGAGEEQLGGLGSDMAG